MADITKCAGMWCKSKETCYRYTAKEDEYWQSYSDFWREIKDDEDKCSHYWNDIRSRNTNTLNK